MACVDDIVNFVDRNVQAIQDFVSNVGTQVGAFLENVWKEVGAPILEFIFGLLGFTDETVYAIQVINQRIIEDTQPDQIKLAVIGAIQKNLDIIETLQHTILTGPVNNIGLYRNYGINTFIHGLPTTLSTARALDQAAIVAALITEFTNPELFVKEAFLGYPKNEYYVKYILERDQNYTEFDNSLLKGVDTWYLDFWTEDAVTGDFTINLRKPNLSPTQFTTLGYLIPAANYDLYYNVLYGANADISNTDRHWVYQRSLGTYPDLDGGVTEGEHIIAEVLPIVPLRRNFKSINTNVPRAILTGITLNSTGIIANAPTIGNVILGDNGKTIMHTFINSGFEVGVNFRQLNLDIAYDPESDNSLFSDFSLNGWSVFGDQTTYGVTWGNSGGYFYIRWSDSLSGPTERITRIKTNTPYSLTGVNINSGIPTRIDYFNNSFSEQISFSKDGLLFTHHNSIGVAYSTILSIPWDLSTYGATTTVSIVGVTSVTHFWQNSGTELYVYMDTTPDAFGIGLRIFNASTPYDITTTGIQNGIGGATSAVVSIPFSAGILNPTGFITANEGNYFSIVVDSPINSSRGFQRYNKLPYIDPAYKTSKNILKLVGLNINDIITQIESNTDILSIEDAFIVFTLNLYTQTQSGLKAIFINFENLFINASISETSYLSAAGTVDPNYNTVVIKEQSYNSTLVFNYINRSDIVGVINPVGEYSSVITILPNDTYDPITGIGGGVQSYFTIRYQYNATNYIELKVHGLFLSVNILTTAGAIKTTLIQLNNGVTTADITIQKNFSFPLPYLVLSDLTYQEKVIVIYEALSLSIYASNSIHLEYYETAGFLSFISAVFTVIAIVLLVVSWGTSSSWSTALWSLAQSLLIAYALNYVLKEILVKNRDNDSAKAIAIAAYIIAAYYGSNTSGLSTAEVLLLLVSAGIQAVSIEVGLQADDLQAEIDSFIKTAEERQQEIDDAQDLLDSSSGLTPGEIAAYLPVNFYESPKDFYDRTIHNGNPGVLSLNQIDNYVENLLELPELDNHTFDPSSPYN